MKKAIGAKQEGPIRIGVVNYPGAQRAAVYGLADFLASAARLHEQRTGARVLEVILCEEGAGWQEPQDALTAIILPPSLSEEPPGVIGRELSRWLLARHQQGTVLCSVCAGAFLLGQLKVLDGRPATTHWGLRDIFAERFPAVILDTDKLVIDDGDIITAGGLMAWVDLGLQLVGRYLGSSTLLATARFFLVDPGGREQRFYSAFSPVLSHGDGAILKVQRWLQKRIGKPTSVDQMAHKASLGRRTFLRRFAAATGLKSTEYVQHLCVGKAREWLELGSESQQQIAWKVGYEDVGSFRKVFVKLMGLSPGEYRRRFACGTVKEA